MSNQEREDERDSAPRYLDMTEDSGPGEVRFVADPTLGRTILAGMVFFFMVVELVVCLGLGLVAQLQFIAHLFR